MSGGLAFGDFIGSMKATRYFEEILLRKRPYIEKSMCLAVLAAPLRRDVQKDGRSAIGEG